MKISEQLKAAKELISTPDKWTKGAFHKDGRICSSQAINIVYKALGLRYQGDAAYMTGDAYVKFCAVNGIPSFGIAVFNDSHTHEEVLTAFDKAIAASEKANQ